MANEDNQSVTQGVITFDRLEHSLKAEKLLRAAGIEARAVTPPHCLDTGCNLVVLFDLSKREEVEQVLRQKQAEYVDIGPLDDNPT